MTEYLGDVCQEAGAETLTILVNISPNNPFDIEFIVESTGQVITNDYQLIPLLRTDHLLRESSTGRLMTPYEAWHRYHLRRAKILDPCRFAWVKAKDSTPK